MINESGMKVKFMANNIANKEPHVENEDLQGKSGHNLVVCPPQLKLIKFSILSKPDQIKIVII